MVRLDSQHWENNEFVKVMLQEGINLARHFARIVTETFEGIPPQVKFVLTRTMLYVTGNCCERQSNLNNCYMTESGRVRLC